LIGNESNLLVDLVVHRLECEVGISTDWLRLGSTEGDIVAGRSSLPWGFVGVEVSVVTHLV